MSDLETNKAIALRLVEVLNGRQLDCHYAADRSRPKGLARYETSRKVLGKEYYNVSIKTRARHRCYR